MNRCDISEYGEPDSELEDLRDEWGRIDLDQDAWLALTPKDELVGYAAVTPWGANLRFHLYVDPADPDYHQLMKALLERCEKRAAAIASQPGSTGDLMAVIYIAHINQRETEIVRQAAYQAKKFVFNMQADLEGAAPEARWPEGVTVRTARPGNDDRPIYELIQETFARPGRNAPSFEDWKSLLMRPDIFNPELWFLAESEGRMIGACLCPEYQDARQGWVRQLGVLSAWRKKGIGAALLRHAFGEFKRRGFSKAGLAVESDNPNAVTFYEGVGMRAVRRYDEYQKAVEMMQRSEG
jgi:ribosomal protein S18 acetylase RimI-like enzyme